MKQIQNVVLKNEGKYVINKTFISNSISVLGWSAGECLFYYCPLVLAAIAR